MVSERLEFVAFRAPRPLVEKLDELAQQTGRNRSAVLRLLVERAEVGQPDIRLSRRPRSRAAAHG